jgi:hydroxymethylpyrimidine/phosphomethylpyrimidine kinase
MGDAEGAADRDHAPGRRAVIAGRQAGARRAATAASEEEPRRPEPRTAIALTVAGSDPSGGAGIQADLKTFTAFGVYGAAVLTALTAQNTLGVTGVHAVPPEFIREQIAAVASDLAIGAVKTGMLADRETVLAVGKALQEYRMAPVIVDPVMVATSGDPLIAPDAIDAVRRALVPLADLLTPNLHEAARLLERPPARTEADCEAQGKALLALGARAVLVKGGHGTGADALDILVHDSETLVLRASRIETANTHGTGCTLSAAIAALMARGVGLHEAVRRAKAFVWQALHEGRELGIGSGSGPLDHLFAIRKQPPPA